ncbi:MAG: GNAT family N-acetyltransferase [Patescibacteria group bacterium]
MENLIENNLENGPVEAKTITPQELREIIFDEDGYKVKDKRFLPKEEGGVFHYFRPEDLNTENYFSIIKEGNLITGVAALQKSPFTEKLFWMKSISIDPEYQGKHYATKLVEEIVRFTKEQGYHLEVSSYSSREAKAKLQRLFDEFADKYGVTLVSDK